MNKILLAVVAAFLLLPNVYATKLVKIVKNESSVQIRTPDGELSLYKEGEKVPELLYGSKIIAGSKPVSVQFFNTAVIVLEKNQGIFFTKDPINKTIEIYKLETKSKDQKIKVILPGNITAYFGADAKITLKEQFPSIYLGVKTGFATVEDSDGTFCKLAEGDDYEAKQNLLNDF
ncbi:MAG: hypothetical protein FWD54_01985 [Endomicrobia bacterium]|nr:hypothetical protein [Endomicrobiia bacterium]